MSYPHYLSLFRRPQEALTAGDQMIGRYRAYNYSHRISSFGWFDTASCDIQVRGAGLQSNVLERLLGTRAAIYVLDPIQPVWEGFVNRVSFVKNGVEWSISLDAMANRVSVIYSNTSVSPAVTTLAAAVNDTTSQGVYGIKGTLVDLPKNYGTTGVATYQNTILTLNSWPQASLNAVSSPDSLIKLELLGFWYTLGWSFYSNSGTTTPALDSMVRNLLVSDANNTLFYDNADSTDIVANANTTPIPNYNRQDLLTGMRRIVETGDGSAQWIAGMGERNFNTGTRRVYYRQASTTTRYRARLSDGLRLRDIYGKPVHGWDVRPDCGLQISDLVPGWSGQGDNPAEMYVDSVDYDGNAGQVTLAGADDKRVEGIYQLKRYGKRSEWRFNTVPRMI
jgi:hypothetical protein